MKLLRSIFGFSKFEPHPFIPSGGKIRAVCAYHPELIQAITELTQAMAIIHERTNWLIRLYWVLFVAIIVRPLF